MPLVRILFHLTAVFRGTRGVACLVAVNEQNLYCAQKSRFRCTQIHLLHMIPIALHVFLDYVGLIRTTA